jgi:hypothetical protein
MRLLIAPQHFYFFETPPSIMRALSFGAALLAHPAQASASVFPA